MGRKAIFQATLPHVTANLVAKLENAETPYVVQFLQKADEVAEFCFKFM